MLTKEELSGTWNEIKGVVKEHWGSITDEEWQQCEGNLDQLVGLIQRKTGQTREQIEDKLRQLASNTGSLFEQAKHTAQDYAANAAGSAREQYGQAEEWVRRKPAESVIVSFGTGLLIGVIVGLVSRK